MSVRGLLIAADSELSAIAHGRPESDKESLKQLSHMLRRASEGPPIVCLCGSGRFREAFEQAEFEETLQGKIVLTIGCNTHDVARSDDLKQHKPMLDELHLRKIDLADEVLILNVGGYIGESTSRELEYAKSRGKKIRFLTA